MIASGTLALSGGGGGCTGPGASCAPRLFTVDADGRIEVVIDWESPLNRAAATLKPGHCPTDFFACGPHVQLNPRMGAKPARAAENVTAGPYTLWVSNSRGPENVRYEVWLTPRP